MDAISDDYYEEIHLKFLIAEYERSQFEKQRVMLFMEKNKNRENFIRDSLALNNLIKRLKFK